MSVDAVIIGAGVDELVCAHYLARAGQRVVVLEERAAQADAAPIRGWIPPEVARDLELERHGLAARHPDPWATAPLAGGGHLQLWGDMARSVEAIRRLSPGDAQKWPLYCERMGRLARALQALYVEPPPDPLGRGLAELARLAASGWRLRALGRRDMEEFLRMLPMAAADHLDEWFDSDALKGILGATAILHHRHGPRAGGTAFRLLHHHVGSPAGVFHPALSNAAATLAKLPGIEIRRGAAVARIEVRDGRAAGVTLASGEELAASLVVSGADPRRTLLALVDPRELDPALTRAVRHIRCHGVSARVTLALERELPFPTLDLAPSLDHLEQASDDAKHGRVSQRPYLQFRGGRRTADGRYRVEAHVQYAPYAPADGPWNEERRAALGRLALEAFARHSPEAGAVETVLTPPDLETLEGWPEGQPYHAELALDQALWMRPLPGWARYRTPIAGLYLCGPGTHPGGGIAGAAGANAARVIRRERARRAAA